MVDTGATISIVCPDLLKGADSTKDVYGNECFLSGQFVIGSTEFEEQYLYAIGIPSEFGDVDGFFGMSFLEKQPFYIDYPNQCIYFKKPD
jgi:hypothetical protein